MRACRFGVSERVACTRCTSAPSAEPLPAPAGVHAWSAPNHSDAQSRTHRFGACLVALHQVFFHPHARVGRTAATSAPGLGSPLPHLRRDWDRPCHICAGTGLTPATSALGLGWPPLQEYAKFLDFESDLRGALAVLSAPPPRRDTGSPLPHLRRDWAHPAHICAGTGLAHPTSAPGLGLAPATSAPGLERPGRDGPACP